MHWLASDSHAVGLVCLVLGALFLAIGLILTLVKNKQNAPTPKWRKATGITICSIGSIGIITGIVLSSLPHDNTSSKLLPVLDIDTIMKDMLSFTQTQHIPFVAQQTPPLQQQNIVVDERLLSVTLNHDNDDDSDEVLVPLPHILGKKNMVFKDASCVENNIFALIGPREEKKQHNGYELLRYIVNPERIVATVRERFSLDTPDIDSVTDKCELYLHTEVLKDTVTVLVQTEFTKSPTSQQFVWKRHGSSGETNI